MSHFCSKSLFPLLVVFIIYINCNFEVHSKLIKSYSKSIKTQESSKTPIKYPTTPHEIHPEATLSFIDYCHYFNYPVEAHRLTVEDGYILTIFRIQRKYSSITANLPVVLMQHGLLDSSDGSIMNDESKSPSLMLANAGYDVWLANSRGNKYSRSHIKYDPDNDLEFWDFTWDDMAAIDLPSFFQYVVNQTAQEKINYVGHSQGTTMMFAALSEKNPFITEHLKTFIALGPVAYVYHQQSKAMDILKDSRLAYLLDLLHLEEFSPADWLLENSGKVICAVFGEVCADILGAFSDANWERDNYDRSDVFIGHFPSGTSVKNMIHWQQGTENDAFQKFDYGEEENLKRYGQSTPPKYDLGNIEHEVFMFSGTEDLLANAVDVQRLKDELKNAHLNVYEKTGHLTFMIGKDMSFMNDVILTLEGKTKAYDTVIAL